MRPGCRHRPTRCSRSLTARSSTATNTYGVNPTFIGEYDTSVAFLPWRTNPNLVGAIMVATDVPPTLMGDYHIPTSSPARDAANSVASVGSVSAPTVDIDNAARPTGARYDLGADELPGTTVVAFPRTAVLDAFTPASGGLGANWDGDTDQNDYRIQTGQVQVRGSGTVWWRAGSTPGANQEAFLTLTKLGATATQQGLAAQEQVARRKQGVLHQGRHRPGRQRPGLDEGPEAESGTCRPRSRRRSRSTTDSASGPSPTAP